MNDMRLEAPVGADTPVNPYTLLASVNESSDSLNTGWLMFLAIMSYLLVAVAGVTQKDLLLSSDIALPILQVRIDLTRFFLFAPILFVLFHVGVVLQLVLLARKSIEFDAAIRLIEPTERRTHPLRLELHNFFFVQAIAGPDRSRIMSLLLHAIAWVTLIILPVLLLLYIQVVFLPYHDVLTTWVHRIAIVVDILLMVAIGVFLMRPEASFFAALGSAGRSRPFSFAATGGLLVTVVAFSFLVATIPGEGLDRFAQSTAGRARAGESTPEGGYTIGFVMPFLGATSDGTLFGLFQRNLNVTDHDLVVDKDVTPGEPTINLRGRDLRFAKLDRTDLHQADLTGADLEGASLVGADLRNITMHCADMNRFALTADRAAGRCASARRANFARAKLNDARLAGADLQEARFDEAVLDGAELSETRLVGANLHSARLVRAGLASAELMGANLANAALQGSDLTGAKLHGADLRGAGLQAAGLAFAQLYGAQLGDADLEAVDLHQARLWSADLTGVRLKGADLRQASVWQTKAPATAALEFADLGDIFYSAPSQGDVAAIEGLLDRLETPAVRAQVSEALAAIMAAGNGKTTTADPHKQAWAALASLSGTAVGAETYKRTLSDALARLMCRSRWAAGYVAHGILRRAQSSRFRGDVGLIHDRLKADDCPASKAMAGQRVFREFTAMIEQLRGN